MSTCVDTEIIGHESYITHIRVIEDAEYPASPPPPSSPSRNKKHRIIVVAVKRSGRVRIHKARENDDGSFSIGKTWNMDELMRLTIYDNLSVRTQSEQQQKSWASNVGFLATITKPYYWHAATSRERDFFIGSIVKIFKKYTNGRTPDLKGFTPHDLEVMSGVKSISSKRSQQPSHPRLSEAGSREQEPPQSPHLQSPAYSQLPPRNSDVSHPSSRNSGSQASVSVYPPARNSQHTAPHPPNQSAAAIPPTLSAGYGRMSASPNRSHPHRQSQADYANNAAAAPAIKEEPDDTYGMHGSRSANHERGVRGDDAPPLPTDYDENRQPTPFDHHREPAEPLPLFHSKSQDSMAKPRRFIDEDDRGRESSPSIDEVDGLFESEPPQVEVSSPEAQRLDAEMERLAKYFTELDIPPTVVTKTSAKFDDYVRHDDDLDADEYEKRSQNIDAARDIISFDNILNQVAGWKTKDSDSDTDDSSRDSPPSLEYQRVEDLEARVRREIGRVQAGSWLGHLEEMQDSKVEALAGMFEKTIAECEELEGYLTLYGHELGVSIFQQGYSFHLHLRPLPTLLFSVLLMDEMQTLSEDVAFIESQSNKMTGH